MTSTDAAMPAPRRLGVPDEVMQVLYRLIAVAVVCAVMAVLSEPFATVGNALNVLRQASLVFFMASGLTLVVLTANLDLSIGANVAFSACLAASVIKATGSPGLGFLVGIGTGSVVGFINGLLVTGLRIPSFIATYGMLWVVQGVTYWYMAGDTIHGFPPDFRAIGSGYWLGVPVPVYLMAVFLGIGSFFARRTTWGQEIYAIGANPVAARLSGIPVDRRLVLVFAVSGAMAGLASLIFLARLNSAEGDIGDALLLPAITAVLIGGTSLFGGIGTMFGTFVGALLLTLIVNGMNLMAVSASWQPLVTGVILIAAVYLDIAARGRGSR